jgi:hypothetical protein
MVDGYIDFGRIRLYLGLVVVGGESICVCSGDGGGALG